MRLHDVLGWLWHEATGSAKGSTASPAAGALPAPTDLVHMAFLLAANGAYSDWCRQFQQREEAYVKFAPHGTFEGLWSLKHRQWLYVAPPELYRLVRALLQIAAPHISSRRSIVTFVIGPIMVGPFHAFWRGQEPNAFDFKIEPDKIWNASGHEILTAAPTIIAFLTENGVSASEADALVAAVQG